MRITEDLIRQANVKINEVKVEGLTIDKPGRITYCDENFRYKLSSSSKDILNNKSLNKFRIEIEAKFNEVIEDLNLTCSLGNIRYTNNSFTSKITFTPKLKFAGTARVVTNGESERLNPPVESKDDIKVRESIKYAMTYSTQHKQYGLPSGILGIKVNIKGDTYKFIGIKPNARKNNIVIESERGVQYVMSVFQFLKLL